MSKKWMIIAGVVAVAAVALVATFLLASPKASSPDSSTGTTTTAATTTNGSSTSSTGSTGTSSPGATGTTTAQNGTSPTTDANGNPVIKTIPKANAEGPLSPFPAMPDPGLAAETLTSPAPANHKLRPLVDAPKPTLYALKLGELFSRASYKVVMHPYGIGPTSLFGSRIVLYVDSATPVGKTPKYAKIVHANILCIVATTDGPFATEGGKYNATLTFRSDGKMLLPIISQATLAK